MNDVRDNVIAFNDVGIDLLPSVRENSFDGNMFVANLRDVSVSGGGTALANRWEGNRWDAAAAWDVDDNGTLDLPYRIDRLSDDLFARYPELRLYELSPAAMALDALGRFFPLLEPQPIVVDSSPRPVPGRLEIADVGLSEASTPEERRPRGAPLIAVVWLGLAGVSLWGARKWPL